LEKEIWKDVIGFEGWYEVSNLGRVKRIKSIGGNKIDKILTISRRREGAMPTVALSVNSNSVVAKLCDVVAEAFLGVDKGNVVISYIDGNRSNVSPENLHIDQLILDGENDWRPIVGYEKLYKISNFGRIRSNSTGNILNGCCFENMSPWVSLTKNRETKRRYICCLMVESFFGVDSDKVLIDHIDGDIANNHLDNITYSFTGTGNEWRPVVGYEGIYEVSKFGGVRSLAGIQRKFLGGVLKLFANEWGYLRVDLQYNKKRKSRLVHQIVAESFIGPRPDGMEINHIDGDKTNNCADNLEYVTHSDNVKHAFKTGIMIPKRGEDNPASVLTESDVIKIREMIANGMTNVEIAAQFNVTPENIYLIRNDKSWKWLK